MILAGVIAEEKPSGGGGGGGVAFVASVVVQDVSFSPSITSSAIDTDGANFLVAILSSYDGSAAGDTISDSYGNTWHHAALGGFPWIYNQGHQVYYAFNATTGPGHTFTMGATSDGCPGVCLMAFSGMPTSDPLEAIVANPWNSENGVSSMTAATTAQTPAHAGDLIISGLSGDVKMAVLTVDSGFTIAGQIAPSNTCGVAGAYLIAPNTSAVNPTWGNFPSGGVSNGSLLIFSKT